MLASQRIEFFRLLQADNPHPTTELAYGSTFQLLIAVILSAQATDKGVNLATRQLFIDAPDAATMAAREVTGLVPYIKPIGLYPTKAKNVIATCKILRDQYAGEVPDDRAALEALPGVGRKTANVVLNTAFGQPTMAVDTHIFRVSNRTGLAPGKTPLAVERDLLQRVPAEYAIHAHHWFILLGRYVCQARKPRCWECRVAPYCYFQPKSFLAASKT